MSAQEQTTLVPDEVKNFHFRVTMVKWRPYTDLFDVPGGRPKLQGPMGNIVESVVTRYNFSYEIMSPEDGSWGMIYENDTATGMIGMLLRNESDWASNPFGHNPERFRLLTLTSEFKVQHLSILAGRTFGVVENYFGIFEAFSPKVWLCLAALSFAIPAIVVGSRVFEPTDENYMKTSIPALLQLYSRTFLNFGRTMLFESISRNDLPKGKSGQLLMAIWLLSCFLIMSIFLGNMKASLMVSSQTSKIDDLEDVAANSAIRPIIWKGTGYHRQFMLATSGLYKTIYNRALEKKGFLPGRELYTERNFRSVLKGRAVFINDEASVMYNVGIVCSQLKNYPGELYFSREPVYAQGLSMGLRKTLHPALKRLISKTIRELQETGNIRKWMNDAMSLYFSCAIVAGASKKEDVTALALGFSSVKGLLVLYSMGLGSALISFIAEVFVNHSARRRELLPEEKRERGGEGTTEQRMQTWG